MDSVSADIGWNDGWMQIRFKEETRLNPGDILLVREDMLTGKLVVSIKRNPCQTTCGPASGVV